MDKVIKALAFVMLASFTAQTQGAGAADARIPESPLTISTEKDISRIVIGASVIRGMLSDSGGLRVTIAESRREIQFLGLEKSPVVAFAVAYTDGTNERYEIQYSSKADGVKLVPTPLY